MKITATVEKDGNCLLIKVWCGSVLLDLWRVDSLTQEP